MRGVFILGNKWRDILLPTGFGIVVVLIAALSVIAVTTLRSNTHQAESLEARNFGKIEAAEAMRSVILKRSHLLALVPTMEDYFERDEAREAFNALVRDYIVYRETLIGLLERDGRLDLSQALRARNPLTNRYIQTAMDKAVDLDPDVDLTPYMRNAFETLAANRAAVDQIIDAARADRAAWVQDNARANLDIQFLLSALGAGGTVVGILIALIVVSRERAYLKKLLRENETRRKAEAALLIARDTLEENVRERTLQLSEEVEERRNIERSLLLSEDAIRNAKEDAERASAVKSDFLANMSHELRSPLNAIIGFSETMKMGVFGEIGGGPDSKYDGYVTDILDSSRHLLALINDILDLSVIEAGQLTLHEEAFSPLSVAEQALHMVAPQATAKGIELDVQLGGAAVRELNADMLRVRQMLLNLLTNALKFTPEGGTVGLRVYQGDDEEIRVSVSDTGVGMSDEDLAVALSKFGQLGGSSNTAHEGVGLGLPLVHSLMVLHGGTLDVESSPGNGTTFTLAFPPARTVQTA